MRNQPLLIIVFILSLSLSFLAQGAQAKHSDIQSIRNSLSLGDTRFSGLSTKNTQAKEHFLLGAAFLEAFIYDLAIVQFQEAQKLDPGFAMSYWGEVMATKHPIWHYENLPAAKAALARYEANQDGRVLSDKEKGYMKAVKEMVDNPTLEARDKAYLKQMQTLQEKFPNDPNIASFYTLSILGLAADYPEDPLSKSQLEKGKHEIDRLITKFPKHPGIVHYYLHYHDTADRAYAEKALPAAKTALTVMKSSSHVTHMAAHIYRRLDLWDDYIYANELSIKASDHLCQLFKIEPLYQCDAENKYHSMEWLQEGYLQKKRVAEADKLVKEIAAIAHQDNGLMYQMWYYKMWARQVLASQDWKMKQIDVKPIAFPGDDLYLASYAECGALLASGFLGVHQHQPIEKTLKRMETLVQQTSHLPDQYVRQTCEISLYELRAEQARMKGALTKATDYAYQARAISRKQISTELTPSIPFLSAEQYCQKHYK